MIKPLLGNLKKGLLFIVSAPAGTGKTTLVQMLIQEFPSVVCSISSTTRQPRPGEINGVHYHFLSHDEFTRHIRQDDFLEYVTLYGDYYGTSRKWVEEQQSMGKDVILVIDTQGALILKDKIPATFIFIAPPSMEELERRLRKRETETHQALEKRMQWAKQEMLAVNLYDYCVVNDDLKTAYQTLRSILIAEEHRVR